MTRLRSLLACMALVAQACVFPGMMQEDDRQLLIADLQGAINIAEAELGADAEPYTSVLRDVLDQIRIATDPKGGWEAFFDAAEQQLDQIAANDPGATVAVEAGKSLLRRAERYIVRAAAEATATEGATEPAQIEVGPPPRELPSSGGP